MPRSKHFHYKGDELFCEDVPLSFLPSGIADPEKYDSGTPVYVYSSAQLTENVRSYKDAFADRKHIIGFSLKANSNKRLLAFMKREGLSLVAVSGFEIRLALDLGFPGERIYFNGNGKQEWEMRLALRNGVIMNVDSVFNAKQLVDIIQSSPTVKYAEVTIRLNIDLDVHVHPYLNTVPYTYCNPIYNDSLGKSYSL